MMKMWLLIFMGLSFSWLGHAQEKPSFKKRGAFSLIALGGFQQTRLTNAEGHMVGYDGTSMGFRFGLEPFDEWLNGFGFYVSGMEGNAHSSSDDSESFKLSQYEFGITQYVNSILFLNGGYRSQSLKIKNSSIDKVEMTTKGLSLGLGLDVLTIGQAFAVSLSANAFFGYSPRDGGHAYNTGGNTIEYLIGLRWTPTVIFSAGGN